jgi:hypothetical protein
MMQRSIALVLVLCITNIGPSSLAHDPDLFDINSTPCDVPYPMLLQQERELFPALPRNLLILFLVLSFLIPIVKYVFRLLKAQVELFLAAANQDEEDLELNE